MTEQTPVEELSRQAVEAAMSIHNGLSQVKALTQAARGQATDGNVTVRIADIPDVDVSLPLTTVFAACDADQSAAVINRLNEGLGKQIARLRHLGDQLGAIYEQAHAKAQQERQARVNPVGSDDDGRRADDGNGAAESDDTGGGSQDPPS